MELENHHLVTIMVVNSSVRNQYMWKSVGESRKRKIIFEQSQVSSYKLHTNDKKKVLYTKNPADSTLFMWSKLSSMME